MDYEKWKNFFFRKIYDNYLENEYHLQCVLNMLKINIFENFFLHRYCYSALFFEILFETE